MSEPLPDWAPETIDTSKASAARMYDYYLGGAHNFSVDRQLARKVLEVFPDIPIIMQANRAFLRRAVRYLVERGVRQFIDIGSGIPTEGNVHETVEAAAPGEDYRLLYVDRDPVAVTHSELILGDAHPGVRVLQADLRSPAEILESARRFLDLSRPVAVLMVAVLHFILDEEQPAELVRAFTDAVPPGSYLVMSHATPGDRPHKAEKLNELYRSSTDPTVQRTREEVAALFAGWELVEPGLVWLEEWRPDWPDEVSDDPSVNGIAAGVARKP
jgi:S-adenosyl methyltransferase